MCKAFSAVVKKNGDVGDAMKKILFVDDDPRMLLAVERQLRDVYEVKTWMAPVDLKPGEFAAALLDWNPHGNVMSSRCMNAGIPYVIYSADPDSGLRGIHCLAKPATRKELIAALDEVMK